MASAPGAVLVDMSVDPDHMIFVKPAPVDTKTLMTVGEVSKVFFGRDAHWLRRVEDRQMLNDEDGKLVVRRGRKGTEVIDDRTQNEDMARCYTLSDVELMTHALARNGAITPAQQLNALRVVKAMAIAWGLL